MKTVFEIFKRFCSFRVQLFLDTQKGTTCIYQRTVYMPLSATGVMASERERASSYLPCGFHIRTSVLQFTDEDVHVFTRSSSHLVYESTSDFRFLFREVQHTAVHYIDF